MTIEGSGLPFKTHGNLRNYGTRWEYRETFYLLRILVAEHVQQIHSLFLMYHKMGLETQYLEMEARAMVEFMRNILKFTGNSLEYEDKVRN